MDFDYDTETITPDNTGSLTIGGTGALELPSGTTLQRPASPIGPMLRFNTDLNVIENYDTVGIAWGTVLTTSNSTSTILGTTNQITVTPGSGNVTLSIPNPFVAPGNVTISGTLIQTLTTGIAAVGLTQVGGTALTTHYNVITTADSGNRAVVLPVPVVGTEIVVDNDSSTFIYIFPSSGCAIDSSGTDANIFGLVNQTWVGVAVSATQWETKVGGIGGGTGITVEAPGGVHPGYFSVINAGVTTFSGDTTGLTPNTPTAGAIVLGGTLIAVNGGTGQNTYAVGDLLVGGATNTLDKLADVATGSVLISGGVGVAPSWSSTPIITTSLQVGSGSGANAGIFIGNQSSSFAGIWSTGLTPNSGNYALLVGATTTQLNAPAAGTVFLGINQGQQVSFNGVELAVAGYVTATNGVNNLTTATGIVSVSAAAAPSFGQVLTATDSTHATWQDVTATNVILTSKSDNTNYYLTFVAANSSTTQGMDVGPATYNPSTGTLVANNIQATGYLIDGSQTVAGTGTTQGTAAAITAGVVKVTPSGANSGVILPTAIAGMMIFTNNDDVSNGIWVYPAVGATIDGGTVNVGTYVPPNNSMQFGATSSTNWDTFTNAPVSGSGMTVTHQSGTSTGQLLISTAIGFKGDLLVGNGFNSATNLTVGTDTYVLTADATQVTGMKWAAPATGGVTTFSAGTTGFTPNSAIAGAITLAGTLIAINGGTGQNTTTTGDLLVGGAANVWNKLADVATGSVLISGGIGIAPSWSTTPTFVGTNISGTAASLTAGHVTNATLTTALTVDTGTVTLHGNAANTSALTIGAGAVSVSGSNTGDQTTISGNAGTATALQTARAIYGNNFDGTAALTQIIASTYGGTGNGFTKFSGPTTAEKTKTLRDATDTILELGGSYTPTGTWTSLTMVTPVLGTPTSGNLTNCTFPTLNQNTTGSAASLSISGQTGLLTFTGLLSTNRIKTVRDAADTILELGGSYTPTGTWTSLTMVTPVLGTPTSGNLANCTFPTLNQNTSGTAAGLSATLVATSGGTGQNTTTTGDLLVGGAANVWNKLADVATGSVLISGGVGVAPSWSTTPTFVGTNITGTGASFTAGTATNATNVTLTTQAGNTNYFLTFVGANSSTNQALDVGPATYNPSTGVLTATAFVGNLSVTTTASASTFYPVLGTANSSTNQTLNVSTLSYVPSTGTLTAPGPIYTTVSATYGSQEVGYLNLPQHTGILTTAGYTLALTDASGHIYAVPTATRILTIPANSSVAFPIGTAITVVNDAGGAFNITISITTDTLVLSPGGTTGSRTLARYGMCTMLKVTATRWIISGTGLT